MTMTTSTMESWRPGVREGNICRRWSVRCFRPWAKQFQINPKDPLIHACIYGKVGDFSPTLLFQVEWGQLKRLSYLHLVEAIGERKGRTTRARALARLASAGRGQWARMHDMRVNGPAIFRFNLAGARLPFATWKFCMHGGDCAGIFGKQLFLYYGKCVKGR